MKSRTSTGYNHRPFTQSLFAVSLIAISVAHTAQAVDDGKNYPGSMCARYSGASALITSTAAIANNNNSTLNVVCPVIKDKMGGDIKHVRITTIDPGAGSIVCRPVSHYRNNAQWFGDWPNSKFSSNGDPRVINFNNVNLNGTSQSHYYIRCSIPKKLSNGKKFQIVSYHVTEK